MRIGIRITLAVVAAVAAAVAIAYAAVSQTIALGRMDHSDLFGGPATVFMRTLTIAPQEVLGWHYHPGVGAYTVETQGRWVWRTAAGTKWCMRGAMRSSNPLIECIGART